MGRQVGRGDFLNLKAKALRFRVDAGDQLNVCEAHPPYQPSLPASPLKGPARSCVTQPP